MRIFLQLLLGSSLLLSSTLHAAELDKADNLQALGEKARKLDVPILLMVSQEYCSFCKTLKEEILKPMEISGDYTHRVVVAELLMDREAPIIGWQGESIDASVVAARYSAWVTPTLLFLDAEGKALHKPMVGVNTVEMYGYYLDEALDKSLKNLRSQ